MSWEILWLRLTRELPLLSSFIISQVKYKLLAYNVCKETSHIPTTKDD